MFLQTFVTNSRSGDE